MDQEALSCFEQMQNEGLTPDSVTFICILAACGNTGAIDKGVQIHNEIVDRGLLQEDTILGTSLMGMYAKCGELRKARGVFDDLLVQDVAAWNSLILGYAQQGQCDEALSCFEQMQNEKLSPDVVTLLCVLYACCHSGLIEEGQTYFTDMSKKYCIQPVIEHQTCLIDLFGRAGYFDEAMSIMKDVSTFDYPILVAILGACQKWGNVKLARLAFDQAVQLDPTSGAAYACMSNIYIAARMHEDAQKIEAMRVQMMLHGSQKNVV
jgi:pentatricopeptide repeat protein